MDKIDSTLNYSLYSDPIIIKSKHPNRTEKKLAEVIEYISLLDTSIEPIYYQEGNKFIFIFTSNYDYHIKGFSKDKLEDNFTRMSKLFLQFISKDNSITHTKILMKYEH